MQTAVAVNYQQQWLINSGAVQNDLFQSVPSLTGGATFLTIDDLLAGSTLLCIALLGIFLHLVEVLAMCKLVNNVIGFRFFLALSIADIGMLLLFGLIPGAIIFVPSLLDLMTKWKRSMHIVADTVWFSGCYMNVLIGLTRFACVVFPLHFRLLHQRQPTCWLIGIAVWTVALAQSLATNSADWFVAIWYAPGTYGMSCDWTAYVASGTRMYYFTLNGLIIVTYLCIYTATALIIITKKPVRFRFLNAILKPKCTTINDGPAPVPVDQNDKNNDNAQQQNNNIDHTIGHTNNANNDATNRRPSGIVETVSKKVALREALQRRSLSNTNVLVRTVNIVRSAVRGANSDQSHSMELRLVIPCCVNSLIFIVGQLFIMHGGIGPQGKWADFSMMLIFCLQSIAPPILRLLFSRMLRRQCNAMLKGWRRWQCGGRRTNIGTCPVPVCNAVQ